MNEHNHERLKLGDFFIELVGITHSIPGSTCVVVDTPVGRIVNTGDFRLDPQPLDHEKTDTDRLKELGDEGVLVLLSESTTTERPGRTPSESTIAQSFVDILDQAPGRVFVAIFSTNINRIQMIIDAAVHHGRKIVLDGRSMMSTLEMAVRHGFVKVPKGTFVPIASVNNIPDEKVVIICTGGQGEPSAALVRMSTGDHRNVKMKPQDTVILSSTPIPYTGNDASIRTMVDDLLKKGVHVYRHETHQVDGCGPLHVSGHASAEEYKDMINMLKPKFFVPIYGDYTAKKYHIELAVEEGIPRKNTINADNGEVLAFTADKMESLGQVPHGSILVDQTGAIVSNVVIKDRIMMSQDGIVAVVLTVDRKTGQNLTSPDIISRGFIYMRDNEELMTELRTELKRAVVQRFKRVELDRFKQEIKEHVTHFLYDKTQRSPIVIPVINIIGGKPGQADTKKSEEDLKKEAAVQARRFAQMRAQLLGQDARVD
jgi:ribonuclease J